MAELANASVIYPRDPGSNLSTDRKSTKLYDALNTKHQKVWEE